MLLRDYLSVSRERFPGVSEELVLRRFSNLSSLFNHKIKLWYYLESRSLLCFTCWINWLTAQPLPPVCAALILCYLNLGVCMNSNALTLSTEAMCNGLSAIFAFQSYERRKRELKEFDIVLHDYTTLHDWNSDVNEQFVECGSGFTDWTCLDWINFRKISNLNWIHLP